MRFLFGRHCLWSCTQLYKHQNCHKLLNRIISASSSAIPVWNHPPMFTFSRAPTLKDHWVRSHLSAPKRTTWLSQLAEHKMWVCGGCLCCVKYLMFVFNLVFWVSPPAPPLGGCGLLACDSPSPVSVCVCSWEDVVSLACGSPSPVWEDVVSLACDSPSPVSVCVCSWEDVVSLACGSPSPVSVCVCSWEDVVSLACDSPSPVSVSVCSWEDVVSLAWVCDSPSPVSVCVCSWEDVVSLACGSPSPVSVCVCSWEDAVSLAWGVWLSFTQAEFSSLPLSFPSLSAANLLLVAGGVTMVTGFLGCLGALKEQRCLLFMFFLILLLLVLTEAVLMLVIHMYQDQLDSRAQDQLKDGMRRYNTDPGLQRSWDNVQKMFKCCGVSNKTDWWDVLEGALPASCCSVGTDPCVDGWTEPCYQKARQWLLDNIPSVLVFGLCIGVVQVMALVFSMLMYCQIRCADKDLD
ncbi:hypothetical protein WMY93_032290 [Mugilogobius chulae]|uniref:Tetraspanin n=1 Tax=Mugilogobius chulae TaxID=88201 RepID=A0AAW0MSW4_9GOBI